MSGQWSEGNAPEGVALMTKIDDHYGVRNEAVLVRKGNLWWTDHGANAIYVYYRPTHWRHLDPSERTQSKDTPQ